MRTRVTQGCHAGAHSQNLPLNRSIVGAAGAGAMGVLEVSGVWTVAGDTEPNNEALLSKGCMENMSSCGETVAQSTAGANGSWWEEKGKNHKCKKLYEESAGPKKYPCLFSLVQTQSEMTPKSHYRVLFES